MMTQEDKWVATGATGIEGERCAIMGPVCWVDVQPIEPGYMDPGRHGHRSSCILGTKVSTSVC